MKKIALIMFTIFFVSSCSNYISRYSYSYERTDNSTQTIESKSEIFAGYSHYFEDNLIKLHLDCDPYRIGFYIINKTKAPLRIIWDSVKVYSDYNQNNPIEITHSNKSQEEIDIPDSSSSEFHKMTQLAELRKVDSIYIAKPTIILRNETLMDEIIPKQNNYWLPYKMSNKEKLKNNSDKVIGNKIELNFPIKIENDIKNYTFSFTVEEYQILKGG